MPEHPTARSRCAWPVRTRRSRDGARPAGPAVGEGQAARSRADGRGRGRGGRAAARVLGALDGSPRIEPAVPAPAFTNTRAARRRDVRAARARSGAGRAGPIGPRATRSGRAWTGSQRSSPPTRRTREQIDELVRSSVFPAFMQLLLTDLAEVGQRVADDRQPRRLRDRLPVPHRGELRRDLVELGQRGHLLRAAGRRDGPSADRRPPLRDPLRGRRVARRARRRLLVDDAVLAPRRAARAQSDRRLLDQLPHRARPRRRRRIHRPHRRRATRRRAALQLAAVDRARQALDDRAAPLPPPRRRPRRASGARRR